MEFLKRKHFSLWIITSLALVASLVGSGAGLQGAPTWIYLGLKSPFIEFSNEFEILANTSIPLNITKDEQAALHQEGLRKLGSFIKPVDLRDSMTGFVKANLTKKISTDSSLRGDGLMQQRIHPIQEEMDQKQIILLDEDTDENGLPASLTDEDRKFIVPMALKNSSPDPRLLLMTTQRTSATTTTKSITPKPSTTITTRAINKSTAPEFASNIDDLKNHILYLQNLTKHDSSFQSKFVVFPSLKKDKQKQATSSTTIRPMKHLFQYSAPIPPPTRKPLFDTKLAGEVKSFGGYYHDVEGEENRIFMSSSGHEDHEKITIVPQVLLLNDQTSERSKNYVNDIYTKQRNLGQNPAAPLATTTSITSTTPEPSTTTRRYVTSRRPTKKPQCLRNPESLKCIRQRRREELQRQHDREQLLREQQSYLKPHFQPIIQTINNTKRFAVSIEIPDSFKIPLNASESSAIATRTPPSSEARSRSVRSHHNRRNIGVGNLGHKSGKYGASYLEREAAPAAAGRDFLLSGEAVTGTTIKGITSNNMTPSPTVSAYSEPIDLNPDLCYQVDVMSYGQKKQCVLHTSVMPAISRGARAAIQECEHQFQNRRWNCSTTDDTTVFGPMTGLGSPEMAFIHGLAAATVTSFIARACRDGQLASCGCSRGSRPKQLNDDWTWGGCGDDLEYAYKFATDFIDVRERETKRGTRGVGNPERRRGKFHQRRLQQQQQQAQAMQADDAMAAATTSVNDTKTATNTKTILGTQNTTFTNGHINNNQANSNKTVNNVAESTSNSNSISNVNGNNNNNRSSSVSAAETGAASVSSSKDIASASSIAPPKQEDSSEEESSGRIKAEDLLELQERIAKEILNSKLQEKEMLELQEKINREILNSRVFNMDVGAGRKKKKKRKNQRAVMDAAAAYNANNMGPAGHGGGGAVAKWKNSASFKARSLMNLHNNEAGRRAVIKKTRITCKCHGVSGSCSLITCWQQLSSIREIGEYLREKYEEATEVKLNKRGRLQVKDAQFKVPTAHDLVYLDESPDWCRHNRQLQWPGTHGRICNKTSSGLDGCGILCCGRGYNTKNIVVRERCNCKFHWCCQVKCEVCVKVLEEHTCK